MTRWIMCALLVALGAGAYAQTASVAGTYKGKLPCEECKVIETELELYYGTDTSGEFALRDKYISEGGTNMAYRVKGDWIVKQDIIDGQICKVIVLDYDNEDKIKYYRLKADGNLLPLDQDKHALKATIDCTLKKVE